MDTTELNNELNNELIEQTTYIWNMLQISLTNRIYITENIPQYSSNLKKKWSKIAQIYKLSDHDHPIPDKISKINNMCIIQLRELCNKYKTLSNDNKENIIKELKKIHKVVPHITQDNLSMFAHLYLDYLDILTNANHYIKLRRTSKY